MRNSRFLGFISNLERCDPEKAVLTLLNMFRIIYIYILLFNQRFIINIKNVIKLFYLIKNMDFIY